MSSKIEWLAGPDGSKGESWNPVTGCAPVSEGCANCYAKRMHGRWSKEPFGKIIQHWERLDAPFHWRKPRLVFANSMGDLFCKEVPTKFLCHVWRVMEQCPQHTFVILTKRGDGMYYICESLNKHPLPNVWLGVSCENQRTAEERIRWLRKTPAAKRIVSFEPLLDYIPWHDEYNKLDWVIIGGETGPGARPCHIEDVRYLLSACKVNLVRCFVKQLGSNPVYGSRVGTSIRKRPKDSRGAEMAEWPADLRVREWPK